MSKSKMQNKKLFVAIPSYDQKVDLLCCQSLLANIRDCERNGWNVLMSYEIGNCYVCESRNHLVKKFLESDCMDMIFVDSDLGFNGNAFMKLLSQDDLQLIGGAYPYRAEIQNGPKWPVDIYLDENKRPVGDKERGLIQAHHIPTGLMRINRTVFTKLQQDHPDWICEGEWKFFQTGRQFREFGEDRWFGEDVAFCKWCERSGMQIWLEPRITFAHVGRGAKTGNYDEFLRSPEATKNVDISK